MSGAVQPLLQFYVNSSVALQVIFLFGAFSYLLHSLYVFVTPLVPTLCVPWSVYLNIDASVHSWLYKLLLNRNYVLKMTPEHRTDGSIFLSFSESKKKKRDFGSAWKDIADCSDMLVVDCSFAVYTAGTVQHEIYSTIDCKFSALCSTERALLSVKLFVYLSVEGYYCKNSYVRFSVVLQGAF